LVSVLLWQCFCAQEGAQVLAGVCGSGYEQNAVNRRSPQKAAQYSENMGAGVDAFLLNLVYICVVIGSLSHSFSGY
jgi:hypothetical protein